MTSKKTQRTISTDDVPRVFDDPCIDRLARVGELPASADRQRFAESVRDAARIYARDAREPTGNQVREEIEKLHRAALRRQYERVADLTEALSLEACQLLEAREFTPGFSAAGLKMPSSNDLRDPARREHSCDVLRGFCSLGGAYVAGRMRRTGRQSTTWKPLLHAPAPIKHPPKREAERQFVMHLQLAWLEATEKSPTATVNPSQSDRPFANLVRECLRLVGAGHADAVGLINELHQRLLYERRRLASLRRRRRREARESKKKS